MNSQSSRIIERILNSQLRDQSSIIQHNNGASHNNSMSYANLSDKLNQNQDEIVQMVIELDSQNSATLQITAHDDPLLLAKKFCFQHSVDPRVINTLTQNIKSVQNAQFNTQSKYGKTSQISKQYQNTSKSQVNNSILERQDKQNISLFMNESTNYFKESKPKMITRQFKPIAVNNSFTSKNRNVANSMISSNGQQALRQSRQSVFDRLYQDSRKKNMKSNMNKNNPKLIDTNCTRLNETTILNQSIKTNSNLKNDTCLLIYDKNTKARQASLQKRQKLQKQKASQQIESCTFTPQINSISDIISRKLPQTYHLQKSKYKDLNRIKQYLEEKQRKQLEQCTFQPQILQRREVSSRLRSKSTDRYKSLYEDSNIRDVKRKKTQFQLSSSRKNLIPKINKLSDSINNGKTFFDRLRSDEAKREEKKVRIQQQLQKEKKRRPSTGRGPVNRSRVTSIGQHLYNQAQNKSKSKEKMNSSTQKLRLTCAKSQQLYEHSKRTSFQYLFALMDSDQDGLISHLKVSIGCLSEEVLKLLTPLLIEMQQIKAQLDENDFSDALNRLFNTFTVVDKQTIMNVYKFQGRNSNEQSQPSFQPSLNQNSLYWAQQYRPQKVDLYQLWKQTQVQKQQRLQQIRTMKILSELQQCTFHPKLFR